jgi:hypothetical protein
MYWRLLIITLQYHQLRIQAKVLSVFSVAVKQQIQSFAQNRALLFTPINTIPKSRSGRSIANIVVCLYLATEACVMAVIRATLIGQDVLLANCAR